MRMEDEIHYTLFFYRYIQRTFPVLEHLGALIAEKVLSLPITRHHAGKLPTQVVDHKRVGIILNGAHVRTHRADALAMLGRGLPGQILGKPLTTISVQHPLPWQRLVLGSGDIEYRRVDLQEPSVVACFVENLRKEPWAEAVHRVTAWHAVGHGFIALDLAE